MGTRKIVALVLLSSKFRGWSGQVGLLQNSGVFVGVLPQIDTMLMLGKGGDVLSVRVYPSTSHSSAVGNAGLLSMRAY